MNTRPTIPTQPEQPITRRRVIAGAGALTLLAATRIPALTSQAATTPEVDTAAQVTPVAVMAEQEVSMPDWRFGLISFEDPYTGDISKPTSIPAGLRVVGCQVIITNDSDQPLDFSVRDIKVRDSEGMEYIAGDYLGTEPRIVSQNLPDGERTRGWIWVAVPESVTLASVVFVPPSPVLRIKLD